MFCLPLTEDFATSKKRGNVINTGDGLAEQQFSITIFIEYADQRRQLSEYHLRLCLPNVFEL